MKNEIANLGEELTEEQEDKVMGPKVLCDRCRITVGDLLRGVTQGSKAEMFEFGDRLFKVECLR
jgi:hypothetical protein